MARSSVLLVFFLFVLQASVLKCQGNNEKRSDDPSTSSMEALIQQQGALIQSLQARVTALENERQTYIDKLQAVENRLPKLVSTCPDGWTQFQSSCYAVGTEAVPWSEAAEICERFGGGLAEIETAAENDFMKQLGRLHNYGSAWLGGTDILWEGHWVWAGSKKTIGAGVSFSDWDSGQPDDSHDQDCLISVTSRGFRWDDVACTTSQAFVCEIRM